MECVCCGLVAVTERRDRTAQGYRRCRCRDCGRQFNERGAGVLNRTQYPSDVIALVVLWRLRYRLTLRDLAEMFLHRGIVFSHDQPAAAPPWQGRGWRPLLVRRRDIPQGPGPLVRPVSGDRPAWGSHRHHAQRAPRHGHGHDVLPVRNVRRRHDPGPCHHGWTWLLPESNPLHARPARGAPDQRGIKGRIRCMRGFKGFGSAARLCLSCDEPRNFCRLRTRDNQPVPASRRRLLQHRRAASVLAILQAA